MQESTFPLEIYGEIAEHASVGTLSALSLTCHALRSEIEKQLYRKVDIFIDISNSVAQRRSEQLLEMFERLMRSPYLLKTVQELCLYDYSSAQKRGDRILGILSQSSLTYNPLHQMTQLKSLGTNTDGLCFSYVLPSLSSANIQLFSFRYSGWFGPHIVMDGLSTFFRTQNQLEELELEGNVPFAQKIKSIGGVPPNMKTLASTPYALAASFPRLLPSSLLRLSIHSTSDSMPATFPRLDGLEVLRIKWPHTDLLQGCRSSFATLRYLEVITKNFKVIHQHLPSLTALQKLKLRTDHSLSEFQPGWVDEPDNGDMNQKTVQIYYVGNLPARSFAACMSLQIFEISGFPAPTDHHAVYSLTSQTWNRGERFGTSTTWEEDEWKYLWPK